MAMAVDQGFEILQEPRTMHSYEYHNDELNFVATLWVCGNHVAFQSFEDITPWHGSWVENNGIVRLTFHCKGDTKKMKSAFLVKTSRKTWEGRDYRQRCIFLKKLDVFRENPATDSFDKVVALY